MEYLFLGDFFLGIFYAGGLELLLEKFHGAFEQVVDIFGHLGGNFLRRLFDLFCTFLHGGGWLFHVHNLVLE